MFRYNMYYNHAYFRYFPMKKARFVVLFGFIMLLFVMSTWLPTNDMFDEVKSTPAEIEFGDGKDIVDISHYHLKETELYVDFPVDLDTLQTIPKIPKIIHQTWKTEYVPPEFHQNVKSFVDKNPDFKYYFWTDESARKLIEERHAYLLNAFDNYVEGIRRSDMLRYVVLYEYGGVYADLDTECLRRLDRVFEKYSCVITPEPYEQATLLYNTESLVTNSIMFCQAYHPFLKLVLTNLPRFYHFARDVDSTGPMFLTYILNIYLDEFNLKNLSDTHEHAVYIPSSQYFQNEIDPTRFKEYRKMCRKFKDLKMAQRKGCISLRKRGMVTRNRSRYMFTKHSFFHTSFVALNKTDTIPITALVKYARIYT